MVTARFEHPDFGREYDIENVKRYGLIVGENYPVKRIDMGQSSTSIYLDGFSRPFNSVHFEFFEDEEPLNIYRDSRFNPYIGGNCGG